MHFAKDAMNYRDCEMPYEKWNIKVNIAVIILFELEQQPIFHRNIVDERTQFLDYVCTKYYAI